MQQPTEQRSGSPLRQTTLARWVTFTVLGLALRKSSRVMAVRTAVFVCA